MCKLEYSKNIYRKIHLFISCIYIASAFEGAIRTPAIMLGGYIADILKDNTLLTDNMCEYDGMVHISDWYHILMDITNITTDYVPDSDHNLAVWDHIKCSCQGFDDCDAVYDQRDEIISMRMCGDPTGSYDNGDNFFYSAFVRRGDYKLIVK